MASYFDDNIKLHNHIWWFCQIFWFPIAISHTLYNFFYRPPYDSMISAEWSHIKPPKSSKLKEYKVITPTNFDYIYKWYVLTAISYYIFDTIYILAAYGAQISPWLASMLLHHIITLPVSIWVLLMPHYPWFLTYSISLHCLLILFPKVEFLNYYQCFI